VTPRFDLADSAIPTKEVTIRATREVTLTVPDVHAVYDEPSLDFEIDNLGTLTRGGATALHLETLERTGLEEGLAYSLEDFVESVHSRVLADLRYLSDPMHGDALDRLIRRFLTALGAKPEDPIAGDPIRAALLIAEEIDTRYRRRSARFELSGARSLVPTDYSWRVPDWFAEPLDRMPVDEWR
jgi:hypothetical protein